MGKPKIAFEWQDLREHQEFPPGSALGAASSVQGQTSSSGRNLQKLAALVGVLCLLVIALLIAAWVQRQAEAGLAEIQGELALAVDAEVWQSRTTLAAPTRTGLFEIAPTASQETVISVVVLALRPEVAAVLVVTDARREGDRAEDGLTSAYRQLRFYRRTEQGWQPAEPVPSLWGQPQRLETEHFDFTYRSRDAQAVQAVAAELDALFERIRNNMGLPSAPERKIAIDVVVQSLADRQTYARREQITVASPALLRAPESLTEAAILRQSIFLHLVDKAISEAVSTHRMPPHWHRLLSAMHLWQSWDLGGPLAEWREPLLRWLSGDPKWMDDAPLPSARYTELCALNSLGEDTVLQTPLPLLCSGMDKATLDSRNLFSSRRPIEFEDLIRKPSYQFLMTGYSSELTYPTYPPSQFERILTAALLDYIAAAYGPEQIGALWPLLRESKRWATLIPTAFGVSMEEFEAGWQAYLAEIAGVARE